MTQPMDHLLDALQWAPVPHTPSASGLPVVTLNLLGSAIRCYVLSDGQRVLDADDVESFFCSATCADFPSTSMAQPSRVHLSETADIGCQRAPTRSSSGASR